jgi:uncharacterized phage protein gp47/JayE
MQTDIQSLLDIDPTIPSVIDAITTSFAGRIHEFNLVLDSLQLELFPDTATQSFLERWGNLVNITRNPATQAAGNITATGVAGSVILAGTLLQSTESVTYATDAERTITDNTISTISVTRSGNIVTVKTSSNHGLASNILITTTVIIPVEYNVTDVPINVTALDEFTFEIATTPASPATTQGIVLFTTADIPVTSQEFGQSANAVSGAPLTFSSAPAGLDSTAFVQFGEIGGGTDLENDEDLRSRIIFRWQNPSTPFNEANIINQARKVPGVTRVFVIEAGESLDPVVVSSLASTDVMAFVTTATLHGLEDGMLATVTGAVETEYNVIQQEILVVSPTIFTYVFAGSATSPATGTITYTDSVRPGQVIILPLRDNDDPIIPTAAEINAIKDEILKIKPAHTSDRDVIVLAATPLVTNFTFTQLTPNTTDMRAAIIANLQALFAEQTAPGQDLTEDTYRSAIRITTDTSGQAVQTFILSDPAGDISVNTTEIPTLGTVTFP